MFYFIFIFIYYYYYYYVLLLLLLFYYIRPVVHTNQGRSQHGARGQLPPPDFGVAHLDWSRPGHSRKPAIGHGAIVV